MQRFIAWFDGEDTVGSVIRSAIAHFWFVSIHPFEDGNGRLARILSDMLLARGEKSELRFYNISSQINKDKNTITTFWNACNVATVRSRSGWYGI